MCVLPAMDAAIQESKRSDMIVGCWILLRVFRLRLLARQLALSYHRLLYFRIGG